MRPTRVSPSHAFVADPADKAARGRARTVKIALGFPKGGNQRNFKPTLHTRAFLTHTLIMMSTTKNRAPKNLSMMWENQPVSFFVTGDPVSNNMVIMCTHSVFNDFYKSSVVNFSDFKKDFKFPERNSSVYPFFEKMHQIVSAMHRQGA